MQERYTKLDASESTSGSPRSGCNSCIRKYTDACNWRIRLPYRLTMLVDLPQRLNRGFHTACRSSTRCADRRSRLSRIDVDAYAAYRAYNCWPKVAVDEGRIESTNGRPAPKHCMQRWHYRHAPNIRPRRCQCSCHPDVRWHSSPHRLETE